MFTKSQLIAAVKYKNNISLDEAYKDVRRYGKIHHLSDVDQNGTLVTYAYIEHKGLFWEWELVKGEVLSVSWTEENNWPFKK